MTEEMKIPVSERAVMARIRRHLARDFCGVRKINKLWPYCETLAQWIIYDKQSSHVVCGFDDPEEFARERGLLKPFEVMVNGEGKTQEKGC